MLTFVIREDDIEPGEERTVDLTPYCAPNMVGISCSSVRGLNTEFGNKVLYIMNVSRETRTFLGTLTVKVQSRNAGIRGG